MLPSLVLYFPGKEKLPHGVYAQIMLKNVFDNEFITPKCVTIKNFELEIDRLHKELEEIRGKAKKKFATKT